jgi:putative phage-type endonuclease
MPITEAMVEERKGWIGSSDVGVILGLSSYKTPYDLYLEKRGLLEPERRESKAATAGKRFEYGVLDEAEELLGRLDRNVHRKAQSLAFPLATNIDAVVVETGKPVEAKTAGLLGPLVGNWGEAGTDEVPDAYIAQAQVHLLVTEKESCHLPSFIAGRGFVMFEIPRNEEVIKIIVDRCARFWEEVQKGTPPERSLPTLDVVKRLRRQPNKVISIPDAIVGDWLNCKEAESLAKKAKEAAEANLLAAMGDAEGAESGMYGRITYLETSRKGYVVEPCTYRTLRLKKSK